jgi:geranylgeranyl diphosphate synthase type I
MMRRTYVISDQTLVETINQGLKRGGRDWQNDNTIGSPEPIDAFCDVMLRGGKRLRGQLAMQSYYAHGGRDNDVALGAARIFEIIQTSLLIVDDIADRSSLRRGGPSAHSRITAYAKTHNMKGDAAHYGLTQTMNVAYAGLHKATVELLNLPVSADVARRACRRFHENIATTINGQIDDIYNEMSNETLSEEAIESVLIRKSAYYTILSPIELGASLAGVAELPAGLREYAIHTGCAFQIADDIISTFGREDETGKGHNDDIREGKMTLLAHFGLTHADARQKKRLQTILGKADASGSECDEVRTILQAVGALQYARERSRSHEEKALASLQTTVAIDQNFKTHLAELTAYVVNRHT